MMPTGLVAVWLAFESLLDDPVLASRFAELLSAPERQRARRFRVEPARRQHLLARAAQRSILARYLPGVRPGELEFVNGPHGRPQLAPPFDASGIVFNLSHADGLVALAVARNLRLGIDVERCDRPVPGQLASRYFAPQEAEAMQALPPAARAERFLRLWTLKEAYLKATGAGVAAGLARAMFSFPPAGGCEFECAADAEAGRWSFRQFGIGTEHLLALACFPAETAPGIEWHEFPGDAHPVPAFEIRPLS